MSTLQLLPRLHTEGALHYINSGGREGVDSSKRPHRSVKYYTRQMSMALPSTSKEVSNVAKVLNYVYLDWLNRHMEFNCQADAVEPVQHFQYQKRPLHFKCVEVIHGRHYELELVKEPFVFLMKRLTVRWLPLRDKQSPDFFPTIVSNKNVDHTSGFYKVVSEVAEDYEYLVSLDITRI